VEPLKPDYGSDQTNRSASIATWYSGTSQTRLPLESKKSVGYYSYMAQCNLWDPTTDGTKQIGLLLKLYDTVEPLKPEYDWDERDFFDPSRNRVSEVPLYHVAIITDRFRWSQP
jgi:hypothetical protein